MSLAAEIAAMDPWVIRLAKRAVNSAVDAMGFSHTIATNFGIHHLSAMLGPSRHRRRDLGHGRSDLDEGTLKAVIGRAQRRGIFRTRFSWEYEATSLPSDV